MRAVSTNGPPQRAKRPDAAAGAKARRFVWLGVLFSLLAGLAVGCFLAYKNAASGAKPPQGTGIVGRTASAKQPQNLSELLALKPGELGGVDIALMNMLCAERLPGADDLRIQPCFRTCLISGRNG